MLFLRYCHFLHYRINQFYCLGYDIAINSYYSLFLSSVISVTICTGSAVAYGCSAYMFSYRCRRRNVAWDCFKLSEMTDDAYRRQYSELDYLC